ncbi:GNAT family N-acetyltransferase [Daejeonella sp.]|uniref:GNAT family N-acetyltransferase n=1 Tax=Daejeonella sp. TaxID=2805397 RepID=UPI0027283D3C|nr:GNAT family N-acetyltransferase [Daejeonella sp.]MDO8993307.1 GNAT family N-acetyltransferase [Daejeonella sp.]MDP2412337.1 GNAT family N-acetyltransferase [Daejeonella sp.]
MTKHFYVSTDKTKLDIDLIVDFLNYESYWAKTRNKATIEKSIMNSVCFGIFDQENRQVGFARVITDFAVFAWILDVFILQEYQGKGLGKLLMQEIMSHHDLSGIKRWGLGTKDAHGLYQKFGFKSLSNPNEMMEKISK